MFKISIRSSRQLLNKSRQIRCLSSISLNSSTTTTKNSKILSITRHSNSKQQQLQQQQRKSFFSTEAATNVDSKSENSQPETMEFQAETRKLLDIVANALYTEKEVFLRELISNASDSSEKLRHLQVASGKQFETEDTPLEIKVDIDENNKTITIQDFGIGMNREEMIENLGRIGKSGSQDFRSKLAEVKSGDSNAASNIIGQFGVGFYSAFMVSDKVEVYSKSVNEETVGHKWVSSGTGTYDITPIKDIPRGTKIILHLNETAAKEYANQSRLELIIKKHSNFVGFPIKLNQNVVNQVKPLWLMAAKDVTEEDNVAFYQHIAKSFDKPQYTLRYQTDSPINIRSLLYVGERHNERYGLGRMEPGVSLYSRKVLIVPKSESLLPEWLRFIRGVVDSEDVPLNIGREQLQDNALVTRLNNILTKRILRFFRDESKRDNETYQKFFASFGQFLKEGACSDVQWRSEIAPLLRFNSSSLENADVSVSLDQYVERMKEGQKAIYFLTASSRENALQSPYYEGFRDKGVEVLFLYSAVDEFVMSSLNEYQQWPLRSIESGDDLSTLKSDKKESENDKDDENADKAEELSLSESEAKDLCSWLRTTLPDKLSSVKTTSRLTSTPAIVVDHQSATMRRMMRNVDPDNIPPISAQAMEINPKHELIRNLERLRHKDAELATDVAAQIVDNAFVSAGLIDDARVMLTRLNKLLSKTMNVVMDDERVPDAEVIEPKDK